MYMYLEGSPCFKKKHDIDNKNEMLSGGEADRVGEQAGWGWAFAACRALLQSVRSMSSMSLPDATDGRYRCDGEKGPVGNVFLPHQPTEP